MVLAHGNAPGSIGYRPIALLLSYTRKMAESRGLAPQPDWPVHLFSRQCPRLGGFALHVSATGFAPASIRLEGGGLSFSATRRKNGPHGGTPTRNTAFEAPHDCNFTTRGKNGPPARNCTWNPAFAEPYDRSFTTGRKRSQT